MKTTFLHTGNNTTLLLFFTGWASVPEQFRYLEPEKGTDVLVCHDYSSTEWTINTAQYKEIRLVAWSLGVWAASVVVEQHRGLRNKITEAIAINGTPLPVNNAYGIPEAIFRGTFEQLSEPNLQRFVRRMCGHKEGLQHYHSTSRDWPVPALQAELAAIYHRQNVPVAENLFTKAIVSSDDRIFPTGNLLNYWQNRIPVIRLQAPHYPFYLWNKWNDLCSLPL
ncbi:MAG: DUF452 family protein [Tannerellaceae bacterium]|nr:DUF452 family protein [Tannerellaceae bacterium]